MLEAIASDRSDAAGTRYRRFDKGGDAFYDQMDRDGAFASIRALHPEHDSRSIERLVERLHHFRRGICIVHHSFNQPKCFYINNIFIWFI